MSNELRGVTNEMVAVYTGLVAQVARRYHGVRGAEYDDLYQEGMIAVAKGVLLAEDEKSLQDRVSTSCRDWVRHVSRDGIGHNEVFSDWL